MRAGASNTSAAISTKFDVLTPAVQNHRSTVAPEERQRLLLENLAEVRHIARQIHMHLPRHVPFDDLVHEGVVGLMDAVAKYDPSKNVQLRTYARFRIRGAILDSLRELDWGPRQLRRQARRIERASNQLALKLGRVPSEPEVAAQLDIPLDEFQQILREIHGLRIDTRQAPPEFVAKQAVFALRPNGAEEDPFEVCVRAETTRSLTKAMQTLAQKERQALTLYYFEERTMKEVGRVLNLRESRVSQIIAAALGRLRTRLKN